MIKPARSYSQSPTEQTWRVAEWRYQTPYDIPQDVAGQGVFANLLTWNLYADSFQDMIATSPGSNSCRDDDEATAIINRASDSKSFHRSEISLNNYLHHIERSQL